MDGIHFDVHTLEIKGLEPAPSNLGQLFADPNSVDKPQTAKYVRQISQTKQIRLLKN